MGFFDSFAPPIPPQRPRRPRLPPWRGPQRNILPVALPVDVLLIRNETKAVYVNGFDVYPYGFAFTVTTVVHTPGSDAVRRQPVPFPRTANPFAGLSPRGGEPPTPEEIEQAFRVGVRYSDGRACEVEGRGRRSGETRPPEQPLVSLTSGHGSESEWTQGLWVWGIPATGDLELTYRWPAEQARESLVLLDGDLLRDAAAHAVTLWDEPQDEGDGDARG
ncbi:hypothetical protein KDK95_14040 [Actinospica sp. MGRD01-02]|uniref:Uncharacterized protein n=1 Tax=Actinospica acidithermotolerans TaxID=2828514 RepID=A0A941EGX4_9ACTN|nr:hypothetical protein [Actinospica acidithermotolerans]MBR7827434.1 hypothetical protein [Actinospica acidithermotolerans]